MSQASTADPETPPLASRPRLPARFLLLAVAFDVVFLGALTVATLSGPFSTTRLVGLAAAAAAIAALNIGWTRPIPHRKIVFWLLIAVLAAGILLSGRGPAGAGFGLSKAQACSRLARIDAEIPAALDAGVTPAAVRQFRHIQAQLISLRSRTQLPSVRRELAFQIGYADGSATTLQKPDAMPLLDLDTTRGMFVAASVALRDRTDAPPAKNVCAGTGTARVTPG